MLNLMNNPPLKKEGGKRSDFYLFIGLESFLVNVKFESFNIFWSSGGPRMRLKLVTVQIIDMKIVTFLPNYSQIRKLRENLIHGPAIDRKR